MHLVQIALVLQIKNDGNITMGGIESYGLKLSSRVSDQNMTFENNGNINISGAGGNSLSSGIAILEDGNLSGKCFNKSIHWKGFK